MTTAQTLTVQDPWHKMFQKGVVLWRSVNFHESGEELDTVNFDATERGTFLGRVVMVGNAGIWEPCVVNNTITQNGVRKFIKGIAVFLAVHPPANWTHLIVEGVSKPLMQPGKPDKGGCVFARVAMPYDTNEYLDFRKRMLDVFRKNKTPSIEEAKQLTNNVWPCPKRCEEIRVIVQSAWSNDAFYNYCHINPRE